MERPRKVKYIVLIAVIPIVILGFSILCRYLVEMRYSPDMESVLKLAGSNRKELEKVLKHYGKNPSDSLKLRAAEYLIVNMADKYSEYYEAPWNDVATVYLRWTSSSDKQLVLDTYGLGETVKKEDVKYITGEYLINNIELAFKVWQEPHWGKTIPFDVFCEEILPYRVGNEPPENWREKALACFADLYSSFQQDTSITIVAACSELNNRLPRFKMDMDFRNMNFSQLMASTRGTCDDMCALAVFAMRALGIPVMCDFTPQNPFMRAGHSWNSVYDGNRHHIPFMGTERNPDEPDLGVSRLKNKVYRKTFARQLNICADEADIPPLLKNLFIKDVSSEYSGSTDLEIPALFPSPKPTGYAYLASSFDYNWTSVAWGKKSQNDIRFTSIGKNVLYLPVYFYDNIQTPANYPFWLDDDGHCRFFQPSSSVIKHTFTGIAPMNREGFGMMPGGRFEAANRQDFADAVTIYTIDIMPGPYYHTVSVNHPSAYRYVRYASPKGKYCSISTSHLISSHTKRLPMRCISLKT